MFYKHLDWQLCLPRFVHLVPCSASYWVFELLLSLDHLTRSVYQATSHTISSHKLWWQNWVVLMSTVALNTVMPPFQHVSSSDFCPAVAAMVDSKRSLLLWSVKLSSIATLTNEFPTASGNVSTSQRPPCTKPKVEWRALKYIAAQAGSTGLLTLAIMGWDVQQACIDANTMHDWSSSNYRSLFMWLGWKTFSEFRLHAKKSSF